jgi:hypothetical protein
VLIFMRFPCPKGILVKLQMLVGDSSENHRPQPAVTDRKSLRPFLSRLPVPKAKRGVGGGCLEPEQQHAGLEKKLDTHAAIRIENS